MEVTEADKMTKTACDQRLFPHSWGATTRIHNEELTTYGPAHSCNLLILGSRLVLPRSLLGGTLSYRGPEAVDSILIFNDLNAL